MDVDDGWRHVLSFAAKDGQFLFLGTVCKAWYKLLERYKRNTNMSEILTASSRIREVSSRPDGKKLLRNAWSTFATGERCSDTTTKIANELLLVAPWDPWCVYFAAKSNNIAFFDWLNTTSLKWDSDCALSSTVDIPFLHHMYYKLGYTPSQRCVDAAATSGSLELLKWLKSIQVDLDGIADELKYNNHTDALEWLSITTKTR